MTGQGVWRVGIFLATPVAFGLWSVHLGRDANWDLQNYHWYDPYALLHGRYDLDIAPAVGQSFFSPVLHVPWFVLGNVLPARLLGFVIAAVQSANLLLLRGLALATLPIRRPLAREIAALAIATVGMCGGMSLGLLGTTFVDTLVTLGILGSLLAILAGRVVLVAGSPSRSAWRAAASAIPAALAVAGKLAVAPFAIGLVAGLLALDAPFGRRLWLVFWFGVGVALTLALALGPWLVHVWAQTGAPFYPFYARPFGSPFAGAAWTFDRWKPHGLVETLLYPFVFARHGDRVAEVPFRDLRFAAAVIGVPVALASRLLRRRGPRPTLAPGLGCLLASLVVGYAVWLATFAYYRYAVTLELLAPLALALAILAMPLPAPVRGAALAAVLLALLATTRPADWGHLAWTDSFVTVAVPPIEEPATATVLLTAQPTAYVVPSLPPAVAVISLEMARWDGGNQAAWTSLIRARLAARPGAVYGIVFAGQEATLVTLAAPFGLVVDAALCRPMATNLPSTGVPLVNQLSLCRLARAEGSRR